jgi:hypothetical protein
MLDWVRRRSAQAAAVALASFALGSGAVGVHAAHGAGDALVVVEHDASAHRYAADDGGATGHRLDCLACNWSRTLRHAADAVFTAAPALDAEAGIGAGVAIGLSTARAARPPLRGPPVSPVTA